MYIINRPTLISCPSLPRPECSSC